MKARTIALLFLTACGAEPDVTWDVAYIQKDTDTGDPVPPSTTNFCEHVTVTGTVYYNDLRTNGRFGMRTRELASDPTDLETQEHLEAQQLRLASYTNYYALGDAQVDIYEADLSYGGGASCSALTYAGTTTIEMDGTFSWTGDVCETCTADLDGGQDGDLSLAVKVSLRNCTDPDTRCFSVRNPGNTGTINHYDDNWDGSTWSRWLAGATSTSPKRFRTESQVPLGLDRFEDPVFADPGTSPTAEAANVFASMVDATRKVHVMIGLQFDQPEVKVFFPSAYGGSHSHESGRLCIGDGGASWIDGKEPAHEYGHLLHYWAWEGHGKWTDWCFDSDGDGHLDRASDTNGDGVNDFDLDPLYGFSDPSGADFLDECDESYLQQEYPNTALKEGWADFIAGVTFDGTGSPMGCDQRTMVRACPGYVCLTGRHYFDDVTMTLCDVWDASRDCEYRGHATQCDDTDLTLIDMWNGLENMWDHASPNTVSTIESATSAAPAGLSFGVCALMQELDYDATLEETLAVDGLDCSL